MKVEAVGHAVSGDIVHQGLLQDRVIVTVIQRRAAREEIEIASALRVMHPRPFGAHELARHRAGIAAHAGFKPVIDRNVGGARGRGRRKCHGLSLRMVIRRSEEHTSELQSLMRISYAVFCLKKKKTDNSKPTQDCYLNYYTKI